MFNVRNEFKLNSTISDDSYYHQIFQKISNHSPEIYKIFNIARIINSDKTELGRSLGKLLKLDEKTKELLELSDETIRHSKTIPESDNYFIDNIRSIREFPYILKKQFLLPDEIFDQKLIYHDLLVKKQYKNEKRLSWSKFIQKKSEITCEKFLRRQKTYILLDISASMEKNERILLAKAILISFIENTQREFGELFFRSFNHKVGKLYRSFEQSEYKKIMNDSILPLIPNGQTNTENALLVAIQDIKTHSNDDKAEILLITDGLCNININTILEDGEEIKINAILIGKDEIIISNSELKDFLNKKYQHEFLRIEHQLSLTKAKEYQTKYEHFQKMDKKKVENELQHEYIQQLKELSKRTNARFIEIDDIEQSFISDTELIKYIQREIGFLKNELKRNNLSPLEKDDLIKQYFSLQNYLNSLLKETEKNDLKELKKNMIQFLNDDNELMEHVKNSGLHFEMSFGDLRGLNKISFYELIKLILYRVKIALFSVI